jgi:curved DNA-binding protein CbpA
MERLTVLKARSCDWKRLPLGAREGFFLSQVDGRLTIEEIAEIAGFELDDATHLAKQLAELGAVEPVAPRRVDPRVERESAVPDSRGKDKRRSLRPDPRAEPSSPRRPSARPERRRSRKSMRVQRPAIPPAAAPDLTSDLDDATIDKLAAYDAQIAHLDHYAVLGVERGADKKTVKRAYFALAAKHHPDRYFGKKLGRARGPVERIFHRLTEANTTLSDAALRAVYDATLAPAPAVERSPSQAPPSSGRSAPPRSSKAPPSRRSAPPRSSKAPPRSTKASAPPRTSRAPAAKPSRKMSRAMKAASRELAKAAEQAPVIINLPPPSAPKPPPSSGPVSSAERTRNLRAAAMEIKAQGHIEALVKAAEDAQRANDFVAAANNYRLALSHRDDPYLRTKLEEVDAKARVIRFEKNIGPARAAERDQRWADAATFLVRAFDAMPDADVGGRAARALLASGGDLAKAASLAEQAVALDKKNVGYRITLAEVHLAANKIARAEEVLEDARAIAPKDARVKELAAMIAQRTKAKSKG